MHICWDNYVSNRVNVSKKVDVSNNVDGSNRVNVSNKLDAEGKERKIACWETETDFSARERGERETRGKTNGKIILSKSISWH